ncbi:uncharacterized protein LOC129987907 [Argiope bruennichi]|uniref:Homeobox domain-containing protein n=1 Tax=Argiope bruennichi TaxID=94029 RepID=A0A8T0EGL3_ARGBR|nr:uncharacterized protein LOC129987907 [Argiope bruennichi]KAF8771085.1 hypothetical protein HNY73_018539 [Argiope bruennichi]
MRSAFHEHRVDRRGVRGRRLFFCKPKGDSRSTSKKLPEACCATYREIDRSFRKCAYPSEVEIFKLSEQINLPPSQIKAEFAKRRLSYRERHHLSKDALVHPCSLPLFQALATFVHSQQAILKSAVLFISVATLWWTHLIKIGRQTVTEQIYE